MTDRRSILTELMATIEDRKVHPPARSYTSTLLSGGVERIGAKIMEEAEEVVEAARTAENESGRRHLIHEAADLIYHLLVMLGCCNVGLDQVETELSRRFGTSGLDEKDSRSSRHEAVGDK